MAEATEALLAIPDKRAAKLTRISLRQLKYWDHTGLVVPSIKRQISPRNTASKNSIGRHIWLRCPEPKAADLLRSNLDAVLPYLARTNVIIVVSSGDIVAETAWE